MRILTANPNFANATAGQGWSVPQSIDATSAVSDLTKSAVGTIADRVGNLSSMHVEDITRFFTGFSSLTIANSNNVSATKYVYVDEIAGFQNGQKLSVIEGYDGNYTSGAFNSEYTTVSSVGNIPIVQSFYDSNYSSAMYGDGSVLTLYAGSGLSVGQRIYISNCATTAWNGSYLVLWIGKVNATLGSYTFNGNCIKVANTTAGNLGNGTTKVADIHSLEPSPAYLGGSSVTVTAVTATTTLYTYTAPEHQFVIGQPVTITGLATSAYNLTNGTVTAIDIAGKTFSITVTGGTAGSLTGQTATATAIARELALQMPIASNFPQDTMRELIDDYTIASNAYWNAGTWTFTATSISTTNLVAATPKANLVPGLSVSGTYIPAGTTITYVDSTTGTVVLSNATTGSGSITVTVDNKSVVLNDGDGSNFLAGQVLTNTQQDYLGVISSVSDYVLTLADTPPAVSPGRTITGTVTQIGGNCAITAASSDGTTVSYTGVNTFNVGDSVNITGFTSTDYNLTDAVVETTDGAMFTVNELVSAGTATGTGKATTGYITYYTTENVILPVGQTVTTSGITPSGYNLTGVVTSSGIFGGSDYGFFTIANPLATPTGKQTANGSFTMSIATNDVSAATISDTSAKTVIPYSYVTTNGDIGIPLASPNVSVGDHIYQAGEPIGQVTAVVNNANNLTSQVQDYANTGITLATAISGTTQFTLSGIARDPGGFFATVTTTTAHGYVVTNTLVNSVQIFGTNNYNGTFIVTSVPSATTFTISNGSTLPTVSYTNGTVGRYNYPITTSGDLSSVHIGMTLGGAIASSFPTNAYVTGIDTVNNVLTISQGPTGAVSTGVTINPTANNASAPAYHKLITGVSPAAHKPFNFVSGSYVPTAGTVVSGTGVTSGTKVVRKGGQPTVASSSFVGSGYLGSPLLLVNTTAAHGFTTGQRIAFTTDKINTTSANARVVYDVPSTTSFRVPVALVLGLTISAATSAGGNTTYTVNTASHGFQIGDVVTISGATGGTDFNHANVAITAVGTTTFTIAVVSSGIYTANSGNVSLQAPTSGTVISRLSPTGYHQDNWVELDTAFSSTLATDNVFSFATSGSTTLDTDGNGRMDSANAGMLVYPSAPVFSKKTVLARDPQGLYAGYYATIRDIPATTNTFYASQSSTGTFYGRLSNMFQAVANIKGAPTVSGSTTIFYVDNADNIGNLTNNEYYFRNVYIGPVGGSFDNASISLVVKSVSITNISNDGAGTTTVTTSAVHNFSSGTVISISGVLTPSLNIANISIDSTPTTTSFTFASTVTDTYAGGGTASPNTPYFVVDAALDGSYSLLSQPYTNGDDSANSIFARVGSYDTGGGFGSPWCVNNANWGGQTGWTGKGVVISGNLTSVHQAGTVVGSWNAGNRYFGTNTTGDIELVSPYAIGSYTGTTLSYSVSAQESSQFVVNPGTNIYGRSTFINLNYKTSADQTAYGVVIVGSGETQEAVVISGVYSSLNGVDPTATDNTVPLSVSNAIAWSLAPGQAFQYDHDAGEPVVTPNLQGNFFNSHSKGTPIIGGGDNGTVETNGVLTAGALIGTNSSASGTQTLNAFFNFQQPWVQSGIDGNANIGTTLSYGATAGSGSLVIDDNSDFPNAYSYVFNQRPDIGFDPTVNAIKLLPPQIGRLAGDHPVGSTTIQISTDIGFAQPVVSDTDGTFTININGDTLACSAMQTTDSTSTFILTSATATDYGDLSYVSLSALDTLQTYITLTTPYMYLTKALKVGKPASTLTVTPTPIALYSGMTISLVYNRTIQTVTLRDDVVAGSTILPIVSFTPHFSFSATVGANGVITQYFTQVVVGLSQDLNDNDVILLTSSDGLHTQPVAIQGYNNTHTTSITVEQFTPNYGYDKNATLTFLYPIVLDNGDTQETVYPTTLPVSTIDPTNDAPPYTVSLAYPTVYPHAAGANFQWYEFPIDPSVGTITYRPDLGKFYSFTSSGWKVSRLHNVQPYYSILGAQNSTYKDRESFYFSDPLTGKNSNHDTFNSNSPTAYTVNAGQVFTSDPNSNEWTASMLSTVVMNAEVVVPQKTSVAIRTVGLHLTFLAGPQVTDVNMSPSSIMTLSSNSKPYVNWVYFDPEGNPQTYWEVRIFDDYTYSRPGFSPDTATPIWKGTGNTATNSVYVDDAGFTGTQKWINGEYYWVFVKVAKSFRSESWWSEWRKTSFIPIINQPQQPLVSVLADSTNATNTLVIQSSDNLMGDNNADFSSSLGSWYAKTVAKGGNDTANSYITDGSVVTNTSPSFLVAKGDLVTSITIGSNGYITTALGASGVTSFKVSSKNTGEAKATGFPIGNNGGASGPFWLTITNIDGTNAENFLVKNMNDGSATKADTFQILKRSYNYTTRTGTTTGTSKVKGANVAYGLQDPVFTGSTGVLAYSYDVTTPGVPALKVVSPAVAGHSVTETTGSVKIVEGNRYHAGSVIVEDPNNLLPIGTKNLSCFIRYSTWSKPKGGSGYTFAGGGVDYVAQHYQSTTVPAAQQDEPAIVSAVVSAVTSPTTADRRMGYLAVPHYCGKDQNKGTTHAITTLQVVVNNPVLQKEWTQQPITPNANGQYASRADAEQAAGQVDGYDHQGTGFKKGDTIKVFGPTVGADLVKTTKEQAAYFVVNDNANWQRNASKYVGHTKDGKVVWKIPVRPVSSIPQYVIPGSGNMALLGQNLAVHWVQQFPVSSRKKVSFTKPLNQGQWSKQVVKNGDNLLFKATRPVGGTAAKTKSVPTFVTTNNTAYQSFVVGPNNNNASAGVAYFDTATVGADGYTTTTVSAWTTSATGVVTKGSTTVSNLNIDQTGGLSAGMSVSGTGIPSGTVIQQVDLNSIALSKSATATGASVALTFSVALNAYQNYEIRSQGIPTGAYVVSNTASSGGTFVITISNPCAKFPDGITYDSGTGQYTFTLATTQSIALIAATNKVIPAGTQVLPVAPFYANFAYNGGCPISMTLPPIYGTNAMVVAPQTAGTNVSEIAIAPATFSEWSAGNSVPVYAGNTYGLMAFAKFIQGRRSVGGSPTYPQFIPYVDWYDDYGNLITTSDGRQRLDIPSFTGTLTSGSPNITVHNLTTAQVSTLSAYIASGKSLLVTGLGIPSSTTVVSVNSTQMVMSANATASLTGNTVFVHNNFTRGIALNPIIDYTAVNYTDVWGIGWCPTYAVAGAPKDFPVAVNATSGSVTASTAVYTLPVGLANSIAAGTVLSTTTGFQVIVTVGAGAGSTSLSVRFTAGTTPPTVTNLLISATHGSPRFQFTNTLNTDLYALSAVMFKALTPPRPTSDYTTLNATLDTLQTAINTASTSPQNNVALTLHSTTPTLGEASIYVIDPTNDYGTREVHFGNGDSALWSKLTSKANAGDTTITVDSVVGLSANASFTVDYGSTHPEVVTVDSSWTGGATVNLKSPLWYSHNKNSQVFAATAGISSQVAQSQAQGTPVAVFNWNSDSFVNSASDADSLAVIVERSEDYGNTWNSLRKGGKIKLNNAGYATITDYEVIPQTQTYYRVTPSYTSALGTVVAGIPSVGLEAPVLTNNSWWIASSSDDTLRFQINVQNGLEETQRHPAGTFYPLGSPYPITVAGVVTGRDGSMTVMWTDPDTWGDFLDFLKRGEIFILLDPVEGERRYIFINQDVSVTHHSAPRPYREVKISFVESAPPTYTYVN